MKGFYKVGFTPTFCFSFIFPTPVRSVYKQKANLDTLLRPVVTDMGYIFWGIEHLREGRGSLLRIYIDSEPGVTLEDCARVSNRVAGVLDVEDPIVGGYRLEISSPGLDRPLFTPAQYEQFIGETVKVKLSRPHNNRRRITGRIERVDEYKVVLNEAGTEFHIPVDEIGKARIVPGEYSPVI